MEDIYMNCDSIEQLSHELSDHSDNVLNDVKKLKELLNDLNDYWKASAATNFTINTDEFLELMNNFSKEYENLSDKMQNSRNAYIEFDSYFANKVI